MNQFHRSQMLPQTPIYMDRVVCLSGVTLRGGRFSYNPGCGVHGRHSVLNQSGGRHNDCRSRQAPETKQEYSEPGGRHNFHSALCRPSGLADAECRNPVADAAGRDSVGLRPELRVFCNPDRPVSSTSITRRVIGTIIRSDRWSRPCTCNRNDRR